jgi:hypothetical protein
VRFEAGQTTKDLLVEALGDVAREADETFFVLLSGPANANLFRARGTGTIVNDDAPQTRVSASAGVASGSVAVSRSGIASIPVRCAGDVCRGSVSLFAAAGTQRLKARKLRLGSSRFSIPAGRTRTVKVKLNAVGMRLLRRTGRLKAQAVVTVGKTAKRRTITLRAPL